MRFLVFLLLTLAPAALLAQPLITDRPDFTESGVVVPHRTVQVEGGLTWQRANAFDLVNGPETLVRWAFLPTLELRLGAPNYFSGGGDLDGWGSGSVGVKAQLGPVGAWDVAVIAEADVPTGGRLSSDALQLGTMLIFGRSLTERVSLGTQAMVDYDAEAEEASLGGTLVLAVSLNERLGQFTELAVFGVEDDSRQLLLHHGFTFALAPLLQLDVHGGVGLSDAAPDYFLGAGFSTRF